MAGIRPLRTRNWHVSYEHIAAARECTNDLVARIYILGVDLQEPSEETQGLLALCVNEAYFCQESHLTLLSARSC